MTRVLIVDDDATLCETLAIGLRQTRFDVTTAASADEARRALVELDFDVVVTDLNMRKVNGIDLCRSIVADRPDVPVIVLTAFGSMDTAVAAIRAGAYDFIHKPVELEALAIAIDRASEHRRLGAEVKRLRSATESRTFDELIGRSSAMLEVRDLLGRVSATDAAVLVTGESGTGKEVVARAVHRQSRRAAGPFVAINCAAMPEALLESELFGHAKGAFTDAKAAHDGLFARASGGTVLLDEVGDMPLALQPKLLRVLEERTVRPVGAREEMPVDVRVIAATNRDLESAIDEGLFREDLFYRLNVVQVALPPLRARAADILPLAQHFLAAIARREQREVTGISRGAAERLLAYPWPGNVRELRNCVERAVALARFDHIAVDDLPDKVKDHRPSHVVVSSDDPSELVSLEEVERRYIGHVMEIVAGNKSAAARILGLDRKRLHRMLVRLELEAGRVYPRDE
jgi:two-component system response regulator HydG